MGNCPDGLTALQWRMPALARQKITFAEMCAAGVRGLLIYCSDYKCSHWTRISGDRWPDDVRLSDIEPRFTCQAWRVDVAMIGWLARDAEDLRRRTNQQRA